MKVQPHGRVSTILHALQTDRNIYKWNYKVSRYSFYINNELHNFENIIDLKQAFTNNISRQTTSLEKSNKISQFLKAQFIIFLKVQIIQHLKNEINNNTTNGKICNYDIHCVT